MNCNTTHYRANSSSVPGDPKYASDRGWTVLEEFIEPGASGRTVERPALRQLLARCRSADTAAVDVVLVHKLDRLARNLADHVAIKALLRQQKIKLASVTESLEDSVSGQLVEHIMAAMAEFYSANLSEEVKKGMRQKVLKGGWPHKVPRGYRITRTADRSTIVVDDSQARLVRRAFEFCAVGYRGILDLRRRLATLGLVTRTGRPLSNERVLALVKNPFYCGKLRWNGALYPGAHPALVSSELFDRVQLILKQRSRMVHRRSGTLLLVGVARCSSCGSLMGADIHRKWQYYRCRGTFRLTKPCRAPHVPVHRAHADLEQLYRRLVLPAGVRRTVWRQVAGRREELTTEQRARREVLQVEFRDLADREIVLSRSLADGGLSLAAFQLAMAELEVRRKTADAEVAVSPRTLQPAMDENCRSPWDLHVALPVDEQRILVAEIFDRIDLDRSGVVRYTFKATAEQIAA